MSSILEPKIPTHRIPTVGRICNNTVTLFSLNFPAWEFLDLRIYNLSGISLNIVVISVANINETESKLFMYIIWHLRTINGYFIGFSYKA